MPFERLLERAEDVVFDRNADHVGRQGAQWLGERREHRGVNDRDFREQFGAMTQAEVESVAGGDHDDARRMGGVLFAQVARHRGFVVGSAESGQVEELAEDLHGPLAGTAN